jgi:E3 ubiquitin-protein ligase HECTD2
MGLAVYNGEILDIRFPPCVYKKLASIDDKDSNLGSVPLLTLFDLQYVMPNIASSLQSLLDYEGDVEEDFMLKFEISYTEFDVVKTVPLKKDGNNISLTNENRKEFVDLYVDFLLNKSIFEQFKAFYQGFYSVCESNAMIVRFFFTNLCDCISL